MKQTKNKHTPGPWTIRDHENNTWRIRSDLSHRKHSSIEESVAIICGNEANARLISAAPELLEIAELILAEWEKPIEGVQKGELIARLSQYSDLARSAVKKACGES